MSELTLIQVGDIHGHLLPRPDLRTGGSGQPEGGLARMATLVRRIRAQRPASLLVNTGDTIQGSAEALFTRGQALVDVVDLLGVDLYAPGNWDYVYGKDRFLDLFGAGTGLGGGGHRWGALAANAYHEGSDELLLPARRVLDVGGVRVGVVGLSSDRAINALGEWVTEGITFTADAAEIPGHVTALREKERVDAVVLIPEFGLAKNVLIAEQTPGIDVVLSSDTHEETRECVVTSTGALVSEVGQDGTRVAQLDLRIEDGRVIGWHYRLHTVDAGLPDDPEVAEVISRAREPFLTGPRFRPHTNPINGAVLDRPIDTVVGYTDVALHRSDPCDGTRPAAVSGTSHDFLSAALRAVAGADVGHLRGFRYGTHVPPGPVLLEDLYHYLPVGAEVARARVTGEQLLKSLQASADGTFDPDPFRWTGGWVHAHAGVRYDLDVRAPRGEKVSRVEVRRSDSDEWAPLHPEESYTFAGYWYARAPETVGGLRGTDVEVLRGAGGETRDVTEHVIDQLATGRVIRAEEPRIRLVHPLPPRTGPNPEIQPLRGGRAGMEAADWDARYAGVERVWSAEPNPVVVETLGDLPAGTALDLGTGEGRHALWLAARGWTVTAVDFSAEAIRKARALQAEHAPGTVGRVDWVRADVLAEPPRSDSYDAVVVLYLHLTADKRRRVMRAAAEALSSGGTLLVVGHDTTNLAEGVGGPQDPAVLFTAEDVVADLAGLDLEIRRAERITRTVGDGGGTALDAVVVAIRP